MGNQRTSPRTSVSLTAHCRIGNAHAREMLGDLSEGGLFLNARGPVQVGAPVRVALALPLPGESRICTLVGTVVRIQRDARGRRTGVGVKLALEEISEADRKALTLFLRESKQAEQPSIQPSMQVAV